MSEKLDIESRSILEYRPSINFVQPDVISEDPQPVDPSTVDIKEDGVTRLKELQQFAKNVKAIADKVQEKADDLSKGFEVTLDPTVDNNCIRALQRHYPGSNPSKVTYEQYRQCKDHQRELIEAVPDKILNPIKNSEIEKAKEALIAGDTSEFLGFVSRPDTDPNGQMIPPVDIDEVQNSCVRALVNMIWKNFIKPAIPLPPGVNFLPDEIAPMPAGAPTPEQMMGDARKKTVGSTK